MTFDHIDQLHLLSALPRSHEVRFVVLADRAVAAQVDATIVTPGSLNPAVSKVLEIIADKKHLSLQELVAEFGSTAETHAVVSEIVHVLARAGQVQVGDPNGQSMVGARQSANWLEFDVEFVTQGVHFLPPAQQIARELHGPRDPLQDHPVFTPIWEDLYREEKLEADIAQAYVRNFSQFRRRSDIPHGHEVLQRARLQRSKSYPRSINVQVKVIRRLYRHHRCYLYQVAGESGPQWDVTVREFFGPDISPAYTKLMVYKIKEPSFFDSLYASSERITR